VFFVPLFRGVATPLPLARAQTACMRRLIYVIATGFAAFACTPNVWAGGVLPGTPEKEKALSYGISAGVSRSGAGNTSTLTYGGAYREVPSTKFQVYRSDGHAGQLRETSELRYRYASDSSLAVSAHPRHFSVGWRTRF
jgi:hypothetical protein